MTIARSIPLWVTVVAILVFAGCSGDTHELGWVPGSGGQPGLGGASTVPSVGGSTAVPVVGGSGGLTGQSGATSKGGGGTLGSGGAGASGAPADTGAGNGGSRTGGATGAVGGGSGGMSGSGGTTRTGGTGGSSCTQLPSCNWCGGQDVIGADGCVTGWRCANGADPCKTAACDTSAPCASSYACRNQLCYPVDGGVADLDAPSARDGLTGVDADCSFSALWDAISPRLGYCWEVDGGSAQELVFDSDGRLVVDGPPLPNFANCLFTEYAGQTISYLCTAD